MNTSQLDFVCYNLDRAIKPYFCGTYSLDGLLTQLKYSLKSSQQNLAIFNIEPSSKKGLHWLLLSLKNKELIVFDSFGKHPSFYSQNLANFLATLSGGEPPKLAPFRLQSDFSRLCGVYCIYVAHHLGAGAKFESLFSKFSQINLSENDLRVLRWFSEQPYGNILKEDCNCGEYCITYSDLLNGEK